MKHFKSINIFNYLIHAVNTTNEMDMMETTTKTSYKFPSKSITKIKSVLVLPWYFFGVI